MADKAAKGTAARARRHNAVRILDESIVLASTRVQAILERLAELKADDPLSDALVDRLDRLVKILGALRDQAAARAWGEKLARVILARPGLLNDMPGSPSVRRIGAWAQRVDKQAAADGRTHASRARKEADRARVAMGLSEAEEA
jgi:hypothetical protein